SLNSCSRSLFTLTRISWSILTLRLMVIGFSGAFSCTVGAQPASTGNNAANQTSLINSIPRSWLLGRIDISVVTDHGIDDTTADPQIAQQVKHVFLVRIVKHNRLFDVRIDALDRHRSLQQTLGIHVDAGGKC